MWCRQDMNRSVTTQQAHWIVTCVMVEFNSRVSRPNYSISENLCYEFVYRPLYRQENAKTIRTEIRILHYAKYY
jgi:hypothetical protein